MHNIPNIANIHLLLCLQNTAICNIKSIKIAPIVDRPTKSIDKIRDNIETIICTFWLARCPKKCNNTLSETKISPK